MMLKLLSFLFFPLSLLAQPFEGTLHIRAEDNTLMYHMRDGNVRLDIPGDEGLVSLLLNRDSQQMMMLVDSEKLSLEMAFPTEDIENEIDDTDLANYAKSGRTKRIAGVDCEEWQHPDGSKLWTPTTDRFGALFTPNAPGLSDIFSDFPGAQFFPFEMIDKDGTVVWQVTQVHARTLPVTLFQVPEGWGKFNFNLNFGN
jgi:hypothetical protein